MIVETPCTLLCDDLMAGWTRGRWRRWGLWQYLYHKYNYNGCHQFWLLRENMEIMRHENLEILISKFIHQFSLYFRAKCAIMLTNFQMTDYFLWQFFVNSEQRVRVPHFHLQLKPSPIHTPIPIDDGKSHLISKKSVADDIMITIISTL